MTAVLWSERVCLVYNRLTCWKGMCPCPVKAHIPVDANELLKGAPGRQLI